MPYFLRELQSIRLEKAKKMLLKSKYANVLFEIGILENFSQLDNDQRLECGLIRIKVLNEIGGFKDALALGLNLLAEASQLKKHLITADSYIEIAKSYHRLGNLDQGTEIIRRGYYYVNKFIKNHQARQIRIAHLKNREGAICWERGDLKKALQLCKESLKIFETVPNNYIDRELNLTTILNNVGTIYRTLGEFDKSLEYHTKSLDVARKIDNPAITAFCLNSIGIIYKARGELQKALVHFNECLAIRRKLGNDLFTSATLTCLGKIYFIKRDYQKAFDYYIEGMALAKESTNPKYLSRVIFQLIQLYLEQGLIEKAEACLTDLSQLSEKHKFSIINQYYKISKALVLKAGISTKQKTLAKEILEQITKQETADYELTVEAMLYLCEILIDEFKRTNDDIIFNKLINLNNKLLLIAEKQHSYSLLARVYLLKSQIWLSKREYQRAKYFLNKSQELADSKGFSKLAIEISAIHDYLLDLLEDKRQWQKYSSESLTTYDFALTTNGNDTDIMDIVLEKKEFKHQISEEKPIMILILNENGLSFYCKKFISKTIDPQVIGSFVTGMIDSIQEIFSIDEQIDRIKFKDHTVLVKVLNPGMSFRNTIKICYMFKGSSYLAIKKLDKLIDQLSNKNIIDLLIKAVTMSKKLSNKEKKVVDNIIKEIFTGNRFDK